MSALSATFLAEAAYDPRILLPYSHMGERQELVSGFLRNACSPLYYLPGPLAPLHGLYDLQWRLRYDLFADNSGHLRVCCRGRGALFLAIAGKDLLAVLSSIIIYLKVTCQRNWICHISTSWDLAQQDSAGKVEQRSFCFETDLGYCFPGKSGDCRSSPVWNVCHSNRLWSTARHQCQSLWQPCAFPEKVGFLLWKWDTGILHLVSKTCWLGDRHISLAFGAR